MALLWHWVWWCWLVKCLSGYCNCCTWIHFPCHYPCCDLLSDHLDVFSHMLLNLATCHSLTCPCPAFLTLEMKVWHSLKVSWSKTLTNWLIQISLSQLLYAVVLLMALILSFSNYFPAFLVISKLFGVLTMFLNLILTRAMPSDKHLNENFLWFP